MATKKSTPTKQKPAHLDVRTISWLKFLPNLSRRQLIYGVLAVAIVLYGSFLTYRLLNNGDCNDWVFLAKSEIGIESVRFERPEGWQANHCFSDSDDGYSTYIMRDYQIPDLARLAWLSGFSDGWGMFAPTNAGLIEVTSGPLRENDTLESIESRLNNENAPVWRRTNSEIASISGYNVLVVTTESDPGPDVKQGGRYGYLKAAYIINNGNILEMRLMNSWHKPESRDAWIAKYEPVFDQLVSTVEFK